MPPLFQPDDLLRAAKGRYASALASLMLCSGLGAAAVATGAPLEPVPVTVLAGTAPCLKSGVAVTRDHGRDSRTRFLREMPATVRADHPAIAPIAAAIRRVTDDPLQQLVVVNDVTHLLVDFDEDERVYGRTEYHATLDEMMARRREAGWSNLRDDCDGRAVFAAHLLAALGISWRLEASYWLQHAWVVARVNGVEYDLLEFRTARPETNSAGYRLIGRHFVPRERRPPYFPWRMAWRERASSDVESGKLLGLLTPDSTAENLVERHATDWTQVRPQERDPIHEAGARLALRAADRR